MSDHDTATDDETVYVTRTVRHVGSYRAMTIRWPQSTDRWLRRTARAKGVTPSVYIRDELKSHGVLRIPGDPGCTVTITVVSSRTPYD